MKNEMNRRILSLSLVLVMLFSSLAAMVACSDDTASGGSDTDAAGETVAAGDDETVAEETTSGLSTVERKDFEQYEFKIVTTNQDKRQIDVIAEELTGSTLNDLVYERNMRIEEMFNIKIVAEEMDFGQINTLVQTTAMANDNPYDLYMTNATGHTLASGGSLLAFNKIPGIDTTQPWWDQTAVKGMSVGGNIYMLTGDITPTGLLTSECVLFNKRLLDNIQVEYPYQMAFDGKWTHDAMYTIANDLSQDVDGDGVIDTTNDIYAMTAWTDYGEAMFYGAGGRMTGKDDSDYPTLAWDIDKYTAIYDKIHRLFVLNNGNYGTSGHEHTFKIFNEGRAYFCGITFQKIEMFLRDMEDDYGVLPIPKFDENQANYATCVSGAGTLIVVPKSTQELEIVGTITEALAASAYDMITPSLYEVVASTKNVRDNDSSRMVQMIIRNRVFDMAHMFYFTGSTFTSTLLNQKSTDVASYFAKMEKVATMEIDKLIKNYTENNS